MDKVFLLANEKKTDHLIQLVCKKAKRQDPNILLLECRQTILK